MKIGTKSVLFGAHCFFIHPFFVAVAWWKLFSFPWDPRLWVAFFVHDLGYFGKPNMDGDEGEMHPWFGARVMTFLFDREKRPVLPLTVLGTPDIWLGKWGRFSLFHSRYLAKRYHAPFSQLCIADKIAIAMEPWWLYLPRVWLSGELAEYAGQTEQHHPDMGLQNNLSARVWFANVQDYCTRWAMEHRDGKQDTWTALR
jgi:hypothetical protein